MRDTLGLLIEPVWNRNTTWRGHNITKQRPFNRTSMESKPVQYLPLNSDVNLLIEPVWNRN